MKTVNGLDSCNATGRFMFPCGTCRKAVYCYHHYTLPSHCAQMRKVSMFGTLAELQAISSIFQSITCCNKHNEQGRVQETDEGGLQGRIQPRRKGAQGCWNCYYSLYNSACTLLGGSGACPPPNFGFQAF